MTIVQDFLAFVFASLTSPHGLCVAVIFAALTWSWVAVMKIRDRLEHRAHTAEMRRLLGGPPAPRPEKTLMPKELRRAA